MRPVRAPVYALVALLVIAAMGCPCVWARAFAAPSDAQTADAANTLHGLDCACCCCQQTRRDAGQDVAGREGAGTPSPKAPAPLCARRAHGEGMAPDTSIDLAPPTIVVSDAPLLPTLEATTLVLSGVASHHDQAPPGPKPPDEARRGVVLKN